MRTGIDLKPIIIGVGLVIPTRIGKVELRVVNVNGNITTL